MDWIVFDARDTHTYCRALSSGAVATCFYDLCLSRLKIEHQTFRLRGKRSNQLRQRRGLSWVSIWKIQDKKFDKIWSRLIYIFFWLRHI